MEKKKITRKSNKSRKKISQKSEIRKIILIEYFLKV